jgi:hypothetical protein
MSGAMAFKAMAEELLKSEQVTCKCSVKDYNHVAVCLACQLENEIEDFNKAFVQNAEVIYPPNKGP